jgi:hypothetical protein
VEGVTAAQDLILKLTAENKGLKAERDRLERALTITRDQLESLWEGNHKTRGTFCFAIQEANAALEAKD